MLEVAVGDRIQAVVVSTEGGLTLSRKLARGAATARQLEDAFHAGLPVEGRVEKAVKGGYEVRIARQRAFCPFSQIDLVRNTTPADHEGHVYAFRIIGSREGGRNLIVSRRALLEAEQRLRAAELRPTIVVGAVITGRVTSVRDFGAFVDLGAGIQGLLHVSEMAWSRVSDPSQLVAPGQEVTVRVLRVDEDTQKITLSLKQLAANPWSEVSVRYAVGQLRTGRVTRLAEFGAFIELEPGVEALAHVSTFAPTGRQDAWSRSVAVGTTAAFESSASTSRRSGLASRWSKDSPTRTETPHPSSPRRSPRRGSARSPTSSGARSRHRENEPARTARLPAGIMLVMKDRLPTRLVASTLFLLLTFACGVDPSGSASSGWPWGTDSVTPAEFARELASASGPDKPVVVCTAPPFLFTGSATSPAPCSTVRLRLPQPSTA